MLNIIIRRITFFRCSKCGKIFSAPDIELNATVYSVPQPCKRCGSIRTYPLSSFLFKSSYKKIWEQMEKEKLFIYKVSNGIFIKRVNFVA